MSHNKKTYRQDPPSSFDTSSLSVIMIDHEDEELGSTSMANYNDTKQDHVENDNKKFLINDIENNDTSSSPIVEDPRKSSHVKNGTKVEYINNHQVKIVDHVSDNNPDIDDDIANVHDNYKNKEIQDHTNVETTEADETQVDDVSNGDAPRQENTIELSNVNEMQTDDTSDEGEDGPIDGVGCQHGCARDRHLVLTLLTVALILVPILMASGVLTFFAFVIIESVIGAVYLYYALRSNTFQYLRNINTTETVVEYMNRMYRTEPAVHWFIQCYHFEQKSRQVSTTDYNGNVSYRTEYYTERVNTHAARGSLHFLRWSDISIPLNQESIETFSMTKISIKKTWTGDEGAMDQKMWFIQSNKRDVHYDFIETLELKGYRPRMLGFVDLEKVPVLAHWSWYVVSHLTVVLAVPYRMWLSSKSHKVRTTIRKQMFTS